MEINEEIELLTRFKNNSDWEYIKNEIKKIEKTWDYYKDTAISQGDSTKAARILGIIQGLKIASDLPESILKLKLKPVFIRKTQEVMKEAKDSIQSILKKAFDDFPVLPEK